jgi:hypothetical protein
VQAPLTQALVQVLVVAHCPAESHVCAVFPAHCCEPGTQTPVQAPETHTKEHALVFIHCPADEQV